ncbi:hypothetical protein C8R46DRAFT_366846 [Mycena filopes]|nr:hypothetical protein C8R46DRAFT_366846 [Mycena filopes]
MALSVVPRQTRSNRFFSRLRSSTIPAKPLLRIHVSIAPQYSDKQRQMSASISPVAVVHSLLLSTTTVKMNYAQYNPFPASPSVLGKNKRSVRDDQGRVSTKQIRYSLKARARKPKAANVVDRTSSVAESVRQQLLVIPPAFRRHVDELLYDGVDYGIILDGVVMRSPYDAPGALLEASVHQPVKEEAVVVKMEVEKEEDDNIVEDDLDTIMTDPAPARPPSVPVPAPAPPPAQVPVPIPTVAASVPPQTIILPPSMSDAALTAWNAYCDARGRPETSEHAPTKLSDEDTLGGKDKNSVDVDCVKGKTRAKSGVKKSKMADKENVQPQVTVTSARKSIPTVDFVTPRNPSSKQRPQAKRSLAKPLAVLKPLQTSTAASLAIGAKSLCYMIARMWI